MARIGGYVLLAYATTKFGKIKAFAQRWGWPRTVYRAVMDIAGNYLGVHVFLVRGRHVTSHASCPINRPGIELRRIDRDTLMRSTSDPEFDLDQEFVEAALGRGDIAFGAFDESLLVAYTWRTITSAPHSDDVWVRAARPHSYAYKSFTCKRYRGNRILPALILYADDEMNKLGYSHRVGYIAVTNFSSLAVGKYIHSHSIGYAGYLSWFGWFIPFRTGAVARTGFEFFQPGEHRPES